MSRNYIFCPSSEALLQKCIAAASPPDVNNKWILAFRRKHDKTEAKANLTSLPEEERPDVISCDVAINSDFLNNYEDFIDNIETEPTLQWDDFVEECTKNQNLFVLLAQRLSTPSIEKLCKHVLDKKPDYTFLENFSKLFLLNCIKRDYNRLYLDLLVQIHREHTKLFKIVLEMILQDLQIPNQMLSDFIIFLNENEQKEFLKNIIYVKLLSENFIHHLATILNMYKVSIKSDDVQNYIFSNLVQHCMVCKNDRNYGKLFLAYLQTEKATNKTLNVKHLRDLLENHSTPFRKPCEKILNDMH